MVAFDDLVLGIFLLPVAEGLIALDHVDLAFEDLEEAIDFLPICEQGVPLFKLLYLHKIFETLPILLLKLQVRYDFVLVLNALLILDDFPLEKLLSLSGLLFLLQLLELAQIF